MVWIGVWCERELLNWSGIIVKFVHFCLFFRWLRWYGVLDHRGMLRPRLRWMATWDNDDVWSERSWCHSSRRTMSKVSHTTASSNTTRYRKRDNIVWAHWSSSSFSSSSHQCCNRKLFKLLHYVCVLFSLMMHVIILNWLLTIIKQSAPFGEFCFTEQKAEYHNRTL